MMNEAGAPAVAERNPAAGYLAIFNRWRVTGATVPSAEQVHSDLLTDFDATVGGMGYFVNDSTSPTTGILKVTHGYRTFSGTPTTTMNRSKTFGYVGDLVGGADVNTFELDPEQLGRTEETRCARTPERHMELLQASPLGVQAIGPFDGDEEIASPSYAMACTRRAMFIPFGLVPYVLDRDLSAREAFETLWPIILEKGWRAHTKPLVNFLVMATTLHVLGNPPRTLNGSLGRGPTSAADVLSKRREKVLYQQLPGLRRSTGSGGGAANPAAATPGLDPIMAALLTQVAKLNDHTREDREDRRASREQAALPKTVRERFQDYTTDKLLLLTDSLGDEDLPRVYHQLAGRQKGVSKRMILQQAYDLAADELKLSRLPASPSHVLDLDQWDFIGTSMDAIGTGLLPFSIVPPDAPSKQARKALVEDTERGRQYDMSGEGVAGAISAGDAKLLYNAKGYVASDWTEADIQLELYGVMLGALLGTRHIITRSHLAAYRYYTRIRTRLQVSMNRKFGAALAPPLLVLHFQLQYRGWFDERFNYQMEDNAEPDVATGLQLFIRANRLDWLPGHEDIPCLASLAIAHPGSATPYRPAGPGTAPPPLASTGRGGGGSRNSPAGTSSAPPAAAATASAAVPVARTERVQNPHRDARLTGDTPLALNVKARNVRAALEAADGPPPNVTRGGAHMSTCLSWHVKGTCFAECTRKADHVTNTADEKEALWQWAQSAFS